MIDTPSSDRSAVYAFFETSPRSSSSVSFPLGCCGCYIYRHYFERLNTPRLQKRLRSLLLKRALAENAYPAASVPQYTSRTFIGHGMLKLQSTIRTEWIGDYFPLQKYNQLKMSHQIQTRPTDLFQQNSRGHKSTGNAISMCTYPRVVTKHVHEPGRLHHQTPTSHADALLPTWLYGRSAIPYSSCCGAACCRTCIVAFRNIMTTPPAFSIHDTPSHSSAEQRPNNSSGLSLCAACALT